jgi:fructose-1,6-bisphosphatase I
MMPSVTTVANNEHLGESKEEIERRVETNLCTLSRHVLYEQRKYALAHGDLTLLLVSIQLGCKFVSSQVRRAGLANLTGLAGGLENVQGEQVKKLDVIANDIFINSLRTSGKVAMMVSEEVDGLIKVEEDGVRGQYCVVFDPLDGSSNIDCGVAVGTIFGIYHVVQSVLICNLYLAPACRRKDHWDQ